MDTPKLPPKPAHLLDDLESIRALLDDEPSANEPPLLTDSLDADDIPLLSEIVAAPAAEPLPAAQSPVLTEPVTPAPAPGQPMAEAIGQRLASSASPDLAHLDNELRAAAQLILQDVIDDFVPQIEAELKRRLEARLTRLLPPRRQ
ncbi:DNA polymerase III subunit chi [Pseudomonas sp. GCM10022186]|uniref:DNA polymerase III subunit chi n=1 Tax=Pseudomonas sp. GCM10022186 TaxID=3252650 RepID=UPI00360A9BDB